MTHAWRVLANEMAGFLVFVNKILSIIERLPKTKLNPSSEISKYWSEMNQFLKNLNFIKSPNFSLTIGILTLYKSLSSLDLVARQAIALSYNIYTISLLIKFSNKDWAPVMKLYILTPFLRRLF